MLTSIAYSRALQQNHLATVRLNRRLLPSAEPRPSAERLTHDTCIGLAHHLNNYEFLPEKTAAGLLLQLARLHKKTVNSILERKMTAYNQLYWFQKLMAEVPSAEKISPPSTPFTLLERKYDNKADQAMLFCAAHELHELALVDMTQSQLNGAIQIKLTERGHQVAQQLHRQNNTELPDYESIAPTVDLPDYETLA